MKSFDMGRTPPVTFGAGRVAETPAIAAAFGRGGPTLVVADAFLAEIGATDALMKGIEGELAADVAGEPKEALIDALSARAREIGAAAVVGMGGGAAMDAAKLVAAIAPSGAPAADFALAAKPFAGDGLPAIAIPTTAGTGSEVTRTSIVSAADGTKNWFWGEELMFAHAILDPALTVSLPPHLTAWTGIDAVAHALEATTSRSSNWGGRLYGLEALRILSGALPKAVATGDDADVRGQVLWGSMVAGLALHNCNTHMGHNISHSIGSLSRIHHGLATGLALEVTLPWLADRPDGGDVYALAAEAMGGDAGAASLPVVFADLMRSCGIARELPAVCAEVSTSELADVMKSAANFGMAQNAACEIGHGDLDEMAGMMMALPLAEAA
ncbi:MAG: iron-containing alcohol dehydrogenase [Pseudomonadota bacterium]